VQIFSEQRSEEGKRAANWVCQCGAAISLAAAKNWNLKEKAALKWLGSHRQVYQHLAEPKESRRHTRLPGVLPAL
jgi:hypothetical protein